MVLLSGRPYGHEIVTVSRPYMLADHMVSQYIWSRNGDYWQIIWSANRRRFQTLYIGRPYGLQLDKIPRPSIFIYMVM